jgi:hypothetical protein
MRAAYGAAKTTNVEADMGNGITIRHSTRADLRKVAQLAALDSRHAPAGEMLLAFEDDELRAALGIESGHAVADPLHHTADLVALLRMRAAGVEDANGRRRRWRGGPRRRGLRLRPA